MNEILWDLTALCSGRANGWSRPDLDAVLFQLGHTKPPEARSILTNLGHIELFDDNRYRVLGPYLVRTIGDELVLCGARSEQTVDWIEEETGQRPGVETLPCGLDRLTITEEVAQQIENMIGPVPEGELGPVLLRAVKNQEEWVGELLWSNGSGVNPYNPPQQTLVKVFELGKLSFRKHRAEGQRDGYAHTARMHPMTLFSIPEQQIRDNGILTHPNTREQHRQQATLHTLDDLRRGKYYVCEFNDRFVFTYSDSQESFMLPRFMLPPPDLELSLHMMHCRHRVDVEERTDETFRNSPYSSYIVIPQHLAEEVVRKLWTGGV